MLGGTVEVVQRARKRFLSAFRKRIHHVGNHCGGIGGIVGCEGDGVQIVGGWCGILLGFDGLILESGWCDGLFLRLESVDFEPMVEQFFRFLFAYLVGTVLVKVS